MNWPSDWIQCIVFNEEIRNMIFLSENLDIKCLLNDASGYHIEKDPKFLFEENQHHRKVVIK